MTCRDCIFVDEFDPRPDEIERGLLLGCKYTNYEGYIKDEKDICPFFHAKNNNPRPPVEAEGGKQ